MTEGVQLEVYRGFIVAHSGNLVGDFEAFPEIKQFSRLFNVYAKEYISAAVVWPDEAEPFLGIEPLYGTCGHFDALADREGLAS
jgi:hypothetical protein